MNREKFMQDIYDYESILGTSENIIKGSLLDAKAKKFLIENANAFLIGLISDQSVKAEWAWSLPYNLQQRIGTFDCESIVADFEEKDIQNAIREKPSLHRYPANIGKYIYNAFLMLNSKYECDAKNIWINESAQSIVDRLEEFKGISHKKASLGCLILTRDFGLNVLDKENIDIIYDVHIRRIFMRTGFSREDSLSAIVEGAKKIYPKFPGYLTSSFWAIGRNYCRPQNPNCNDCPIKDYCEKNYEASENIHA